MDEHGLILFQCWYAEMQEWFQLHGTNINDSIAGTNSDRIVHSFT